MTYIWINPVAESMYESKKLTNFLQKYGYKQVKVTDDWLNIVKEKYQIAVTKASGRPVMDMRCPKMKQVLDEVGVTCKFTVPEIEPILIHCAREISTRKDLQGEEKLITTPCQVLADMGNALQLSNTSFVPWNRFLENFEDAPVRYKLKESPIPPGFFDSLELKTVSITGENEIQEYFQTRFPKDMQDNVELVEMLFCKYGCHNGDGVIVTETSTTRKCM